MTQAPLRAQAGEGAEAGDGAVRWQVNACSKIVSPKNLRDCRRNLILAVQNADLGVHGAGLGDEAGDGIGGNGLCTVWQWLGNSNARSRPNAIKDVVTRAHATAPGMSCPPALGSRARRASRASAAANAPRRYDLCPSACAP